MKALLWLLASAVLFIGWGCENKSQKPAGGEGTRERQLNQETAPAESQTPKTPAPGDAAGNEQTKQTEDGGAAARQQ